MGKSTISMAIFNSYVKLPEGRSQFFLGELPMFHNFPISAAPQKPRRAPLAGEWLARVARMAWWRADASRRPPWWALKNDLPEIKKTNQPNNNSTKTAK